MKLSHVQAKVIRWLVENKGRLVERSDYWEWNTLTISSKRGAARTWIQVPSPMLPHRKTINSLCVKGYLRRPTPFTTPRTWL